MVIIKSFFNLRSVFEKKKKCLTKFNKHFLKYENLLIIFFEKIFDK